MKGGEDMVYEYEIEQKDFSCALPRVIKKADTLAILLTCGAPNNDVLGTADADYEGFGFLVQDIASDLRTINDGLYEKKASETDSAIETPEA
jgi:hypothetical protein